MKENIAKHVDYLESLIANVQLEEALDYIEALSQEEAGCWQIQNLTGVICSYCGQFSEAIAFFRRALNKNPDDAEIYYNLADAYLNVQEYSHAELMLKCCEQCAEDETLLDLVVQMRAQLESLDLSVTEDNEKNKLLMVAYYFPPLSGSGVFRSIKHAKYLPELNWDTTVISTNESPRGWDYRDDSMVDEIPECVDVVRVEDAINTKTNISVSKEEINELINFLGEPFLQNGEAARLYQWILNNEKDIWKILTFPCSCLWWAWKVIKHIEANMNIGEFSVIYTTSGPSSAHLIGYYMKKKYGIPWVADYRDAWTDNPYGYFDMNIPTHRLLFYLEEILLKSASCNITIEQSMVQRYVDRFGLSREKIVSITNGYDEEDFAPLVYNVEKTKRFTINYSGLLYTEQRSIVPVLNAISQLIQEGKIDLDSIKLRVVGQGSEDANREVAERFGLLSIFEQTGYVSHKEALQANLDSDILLLLVGNSVKFKPVYTGKVFEYLRSGKPILALAPPDGAVDRLLSTTGHGQTFLSTQEDEIKHMILQEYQKWMTQKENEYLHSPFIKKSERKYLSMKLADVLYQVKDVSANREDISKDKYLVICTGGYPIDGGKKTNIFAHKRILKYIEAGMEIEVFGFTWRDEAYSYAYEGVNVTCGGERQLIEMLLKNDFKKLLVHFPDPYVFNAISKAGKLCMPMIVWCHGYEVTPWYRTWFNYSSAQIQENKQLLNRNDENKKDFLKSIFALDNIHFIFVSNWQRGRVKKWIGNLPMHHCVIHNFLDFELFNVPEKAAKDRLRILTIKSHSARTYANDLTAKAILELSTKPFFSELTFELYGDGPLFEANYGELLERKFSNVHIHQEFLSQQQMKQLFSENGIFLSPTRMDSHQVTASEAMAAGMAVITSNAGPMREFMDEECASIFEFDNYMMMAEEIEYLYYHPEAFLKICRNAKIRSREQCGDDKTVAREIELIKKWR